MTDIFDCSIHGRETQVFCWRAYEKWPETKAVDDMFGGDIMSGDLSFYEGQRKRRELCERIWREAQVDAAKENSPSLKMSLESFMKHCEKRAEAAEAQRDRLTAALRDADAVMRDADTRDPAYWAEVNAWHERHRAALADSGEDK